MKVSLIAAKDLDASLVAKWNAIQSTDETLRSPYYRPEFTQLVAKCGQNVKVAILESDGAVRGFFPHHLTSWGRLVPVAGMLNDYHGIVGEASLEVEAGALLKACGAYYFRFNHMPMTQNAFLPYVRFSQVSPVMELRGGWDAYVKKLSVVQNKMTPGIVTSVKKSSNRIERDLGPLRFEMHESSTVVLETLMRLKTEQRARTVGLSDDPFAIPWVRKMMFTGLASATSDFGCTLCALYAGDTMVACHLGLRSRSTLHGWFSIYDPVHAYYQPALILFLKIAQSGFADGIEIFDMGRGTQDYKMRFCTNSVPLGEGVVARPQLLGNGLMIAKKLKIEIKLNKQIKKFKSWF
jgi:CelD/BcsL family acetyltransferase involved in cellulose biosynthesis